jgi:hypothetical protein
MLIAAVCGQLPMTSNLELMLITDALRQLPLFPKHTHFKSGADDRD